MRLSKDEREIRDAFERGELESVPHAKREMVRYREYAKSALMKNKRVNVRSSDPNP